MVHPKVSVIIPTYNRAHLVVEAIQSVLNQTFPDFELLVIDDGSTDNTEQVVRSYTDPRLRYMAQENRGPGAARSAALHVSRGEYVAFLDSDDLFCKDKLEKQILMLENCPEIGLSFTAYRKIDEFGGISSLVHGRRDGMVSLEHLITGMVFAFSSVVVRKRWVESAGSLDEGFPTGEEWEWTMRLAMVGCPMRGLDDPLVLKRVHPQNLVRAPATVGKSGLWALDKIFSSPDFPKELQGQYPIARAHVFARLSGLACVDSDVDAALDYARMAVRELTDPSDSDLRDIALRIVHITRGLSLADPGKILSKLRFRLSALGGTEARFSRILSAAQHAVETTEHFTRQDRAGVVQSALRYLRVTFPRIDNRGVIVMLLKSLVGRSWPEAEE